MTKTKPVFVTFSFLKEYYDMIAAQSLFDSISAALEKKGYEIAQVRAKESLNTKIWFITDIVSKDKSLKTPVLKDVHAAILEILSGYDAHEDGGVIHIGAGRQ